MKDRRHEDVFNISTFHFQEHSNSYSRLSTQTSQPFSISPSPAVHVYHGTNHEDVDYDVYSEMVFEDEKAFKAFKKAMLDPVSGKTLREDQERFPGSGGLKVVGIEDSEATMRPSK
ncbi:hypothetical protein OCU04_009757 [Sclerotinia nivalis]|uniref:EthD domain-containing protein n=1 Tax=Sclerotinia nivalis TaxID=352851 RepID=A0A9X0AGK3_9HELO|nr:hypothetical protein OCU04_009757 [Sclerotinia nivalis]